MSTQAQQSSAKLKLYFYAQKDKTIAVKRIYRAGSEQMDPKTGKTITKWEGSFFERPWIDGKRNWRSLETESFKIAQERLDDRRRAIRRGEDPYAAAKPAREIAAAGTGNQRVTPISPAPPTEPTQKSETSGGALVKACLDAYAQAGYPDRNRQLRPSDTIAAEIGYIAHLRTFWDPICVDAINLMAMDAYHDARMSEKAVAEREKAKKKNPGVATSGRRLECVTYTLRSGSEIRCFEGEAGHERDGGSHGRPRTQRAVPFFTDRADQRNSHARLPQARNTTMAVALRLGRMGCFTWAWAIRPPMTTHRVMPRIWACYSARCSGSM